MTQVQEERVEVAAIKGDYQYGFHDPEQSVFRARKGLDREIVEQISAMKGEPDWMLDIRLRALELFLQKPMPKWGGSLDSLDFDDKLTLLEALDALAADANDEATRH